MKNIFKVVNRIYLKKAQRLINGRKINDNGELLFTKEEVYCLAKVTGLRTNKTRKINKRFKKLINYLIEELVKEHRNENET